KERAEWEERKRAARAAAAAQAERERKVKEERERLKREAAQKAEKEREQAMRDEEKRNRTPAEQQWIEDQIGVLNNEINNLERAMSYYTSTLENLDSEREYLGGPGMWDRHAMITRQEQEATMQRAMLGQQLGLLCSKRNALRELL
ncbi:MAG: hypothetical protein LBK28_03245, partial [Propionibacteriaceae bacterium]|nr:hypothetical protein [Propionibacteriaceae bacterium]